MTRRNRKFSRYLRVRWDIAETHPFCDSPEALRIYLAACGHFMEHGDELGPRLARARFAWGAADQLWFDRLVDQGVLSFSNGVMQVDDQFADNPRGERIVQLPKICPSPQDRRPLGARVRFAVLSRDRFRCVYCGATPDVTQLRVDHVIPVVAGGPDCMSNLVTACFECNAGKSDTLITERSR